MTRINSAINVKYLTDEHLLAEHREIKRMPYFLFRSVKSGSVSKTPLMFTLGKGHVLFFLDKQKFLLERYKDIHDECIRRGFSVEDYSENWNSIENSYFNDYTPTVIEKEAIIDRISQRIMDSPKKVWHYNGKKMSKEQAVGMLTEDEDKEIEKMLLEESKR